MAYHWTTDKSDSGDSRWEQGKFGNGYDWTRDGVFTVAMLITTVISGDGKKREYVIKAAVVHDWMILSGS